MPKKKHTQLEFEAIHSALMTKYGELLARRAFKSVFYDNIEKYCQMVEECLANFSLDKSLDKSLAVLGYVTHQIDVWGAIAASQDFRYQRKQKTG